jgi:hypothetical protein
MVDARSFGRPQDDRWRVFALDLRSLATFRVALGLVLLVDLGIRAGDFSAMYGEGGMAPVELVQSQLGAGEWSLHLLSGANVAQAGLMVVAAGLAAALVVGFHTRLATIGCWLLTASLHVRLPIVLNAGDTLLRVLLFWAMFLPLGAAWSFDARRRGPPPSTVVRSPATFAFLIQLALVYWCAGLAKLNADWLDGNALEQIFSFSLYGKPLGQWLRQFPEVTRWLGWSVVALELAGPWLLFAPWRNAQFRLVAVAAFAAFHLGIAATITVGMFPWVGLAGWVAVAPGMVWGSRAKPPAMADLRQAAGPALAPSFLGGRLQAACLFALLGMVVAWNALDVVGRQAAPWLHDRLRPVVNATTLAQSWRLFSEPSRFDAWFFYRGRLANGEIVDLTTGRPFVDEVRPAAAHEFSNHHWRKLHLRLTGRDYRAYCMPLAEFMRRAWDDRHEADERVARLDFYCLRLLVHRRGELDGFVRQNLAVIVVDPSQGNFAEALRELEE